MGAPPALAHPRSVSGPDVARCFLRHTSIRDVIAFPKDTKKARDLGCAESDTRPQRQLKELHIRTVMPE